MATLTLSTPGIRAYPIFDALMPGLSAFPVTNDEASPILHIGEWAVIDPEQREPEHGELFVIEFGRESGRPTQHIVEIFARMMRLGVGPNGEMADSFGWWAGAYNRARSADEGAARLKSGRRVGWCDGPYASEGPNAGYLATKLIGRVVGILQPAFDEATLKRVN